MNCVCCRRLVVRNVNLKKLQRHLPIYAERTAALAGLTTPRFASSVGWRGSLGGRRSPSTGHVQASAASTAVPSSANERRRPTQFDHSLAASSSCFNVAWADGQRSRFHFFWLRDNCHCPLCKERSSQQKLHSCADVDLDVQPEEFGQTGEDGELLWVRWSDGHESSFDSDWLRLHRYDDAALREESQARRPVPWTAASLEDAGGLPEVAWSAVMGAEGEAAADRALYQWLYWLQERGLCVVRGAPAQTGQVTQLAERAANVRRTIYGDSDWDVRVQVQPNNVAYTAVPLPAHMDLLYYECPPGIQLLHFVRTEAAGGANFFVDAFAAAEQLARDDRAAFDLLCALPLQFHKSDPQYWLYAQRPAIETDASGRVRAVSFAPPFEAPLRVPFDQMRPLYRAYARFAAILQSPELTVRRRFESGDIITFNNRRVMHGREAIELDAAGVNADRLLQGCYIDLDETASKFRVLQRRFGDPETTSQGFYDKFFND